MQSETFRYALGVPALVVLLACASGSLAAAPRQTRVACLPNDAGAVESLAYLKKVVSSAAEGLPVVRDSLGISAYPDTAVELMQDDALCQLAVAAFERDVADSTQAGRQVYVFRVSNQYFVVEDPEERAGEYSIFAFYSTAWVHHKNLFW